MRKESNGGASLLGSRSNKVFVLVPGGKGKGEKMTSGGNRRPGTLGHCKDFDFFSDSMEKSLEI